MVVAKASLKCNRFKPADKVSYGANVVAQLTIAAGSEDNPFPNLPVTIAKLLLNNNNLAAADAAMNQGGKAASAALKEADAEWITAFTSTANYVSTVAEGSETIIAAAGMDSTKTSRTKKPKAGGIKGFSAVVNHSKGAITVSAKNASDDAGGYLFAAIPENVTINFNGDIMEIVFGTSSVYIAASSKKQIDLKAMPKGKSYNVTMMAFNAAGTGPAAAMQEVIPQ